MSSMLNEAINEKHNEGAMVNALAGMPIKEVRQKLLFCLYSLIC